MYALDARDTYFTDVTSEAGVPADSYGSRGVCWGDYNNDLLEDFYVSSSYGVNILYKNNGDGTFADVTHAAGVDDPGASNGVAWGDYNNDGCMDLYVSNFGENTLFRNNCDGTFTDFTEEAGVGDYGSGEAVTWADYNNDGYLDIYIVNLGEPNVLYRNNGDETFSDVSSSAGVDDWRLGENAAWADYDNDGFQDVYISNRDRNTLYHNEGDGTFTDVSIEAGVADWGHGHGIAWGDYNKDGLLDLYLVNRQKPNVLYRNNGDGTFTDVAPEAGVDDNELYTVGTQFLDFDNDGDLDIYNTSAATNRLFSNNNDGTFTDVTDLAGVGDYGRLGNGMAWGDYNNDGYPDIYVVNWEDGCALFRNNLHENNWIKLKLTGTESNRSATGTRIEVRVGDDVQVGEVNGGSGFLSQNSMIAHFGLGQVPSVDEITIRWPSGIVTVLEDVAVNQVLEIEEVSSGVTIDLMPGGTMYHPGDIMTFEVVLRNLTEHCQVFDGWSEVALPSGHLVTPFSGPFALFLFPMSSYEFIAHHRIPLDAPLGDYTYTGKIGEYPSEILDEDSFSVTLTGE